MAPHTRDKVLKAAKLLNYTVSKAASSLASGQTNRIALLARDHIVGWFMGELMDGLYDVLNPARYDLLVYRAGSMKERSTFFTNLPANRNADALIMTGFPATDQEEQALTSMGMPIILVNSPDTDCCQGSVAINDEASEEAMVRYLAAIGHHKFCYIGRKEPLPGSKWGHDNRAVGYRNTIADLNLTDCGIYYIDLTDPLSVIHELRSNGVRVPEDMSVAGHDGSDVAASIKLTTMAQPASEIGRIAARKNIGSRRKKHWTSRAQSSRPC